MRKVHVSLSERSYDILIGSRLLPKMGAACATLGLGPKCAIITDSNLSPRYSELARQALETAGFQTSLIVLTPGEKSKNIATAASCYDMLARQRLERKSFIIALGGGVVGDLAGFVAATYLRGIPFVQVPTTLLAQVDSSVGGKTGVNLKSGKNLVGAFHQPRLVVCDTDTFETLPDREFRSGLAEVIKYGIIRDPAFFRFLERNMDGILAREPRLLSKVVARCCEIKADVVSKDEMETGLRAILNFGHTIGHGLEAISSYGKYLHGEAISIGQVLAARLSNQLTGLPPRDVQRIRSLFEKAGLPIAVRLTQTQVQNLMAAIQLDKKVSHGTVRFVLAKSIGEVVFGHKVEFETVERLVRGMV